MAFIFCNDDGSNTAPHETWAKAATTFLVAVDAASAGDDIIIGADHTETPGSTPTYTFPGTVGSPNRVISSTVGSDSDIVYNKADNIQVSVTAGGTNFIIQGSVYFYGFSLKLKRDLILQSSASICVFDDCVMQLDDAQSNILIGVSAGQNSVIFKNTDVNFSVGGAGVGFVLSGPSKFWWRGGVLSWTGTQPTALFNSLDKDCLVFMSGVDLSACTSALFDVSDAADIMSEMHHCVLNSGVSLTTGIINSVGTRILMSGCDDSTGNDLYRLEYVDFWGSTVHDDDIFRTTGGASDGTTPISWKMVSTANASEFTEPTKSPWIYAWVDGTGSKTFTVQCLWDSVTDIQDDEIWLEIEFLEASADPDSAFADDRMADISATPADQTTNATPWTETLTNDNEFELAVTVTVNRVGPVIARVCLAKPSTTVYVDPLLVIT